MRVLLCYMGYGLSLNDMVLCVCNLPYWVFFRGLLGFLGVLWGSRGVRRRPGKGWGGPREVPGGPGGALEKVILFFLRGEFVNGLMK